MTKKLFSKSNLDKLLLLEVTAYPGFYKVVILFLIKQVFNTHILGNFVNDTSYSIIFGFFTCVNFLNYVVKDIPSLSETEKKTFLNIIIIEATKYSLIFAFIGLIAFYFGFIVESYGFVVYMLSNSLYTILRYFYIVERRYIKLFFIELTLFIMSIFALYIFPARYVLLGNSICFFLFTVIVIFDLKLYKYLKLDQSLKGLVKISLTFRYALINVTSSGLYMALAPLSFQLLTPIYTALIGIVSNVLQVLLLFTRSVSYYYSPVLAKNKNDRLNLQSIQTKFKRKLLTLLALGTIVCFLGVFIVTKLNAHKSDIFNLKDAKTITILFLLTLVTSQVSLAESCLLVILNRTDVILKPSIYQTIAFFVMGLILYNVRSIMGLDIFISLLIVLIVTNLYKYFYMNRSTAKFLYVKQSL